MEDSVSDVLKLDDPHTGVSVLGRLQIGAERATNEAVGNLFIGDIVNGKRLPFPAEPLQASLAGEELLHGGLLYCPLLGDQRVQRPDQPLHIRQRLGDGLLLRYWWKWNNQRLDLPNVYSSKG